MTSFGPAELTEVVRARFGCVLSASCSALGSLSFFEWERMIWGMEVERGMRCGMEEKRFRPKLFLFHESFFLGLAFSCFESFSSSSCSLNCRQNGLRTVKKKYTKSLYLSVNVFSAEH